MLWRLLLNGTERSKLQNQGPSFSAIVSWDKRDTSGHFRVNRGLESGVRWRKYFWIFINPQKYLGCWVSSRDVCASLQPFYQAQLLLDVVLEAFLKCLACASLRFFYLFSASDSFKQRSSQTNHIYMCVYKNIGARALFVKTTFMLGCVGVWRVNL